jgi:hypothetical protein
MVKEGTSQSCALIADAGRAKFKATFNTTELMCSREVSAGYISYSLVLGLIYMLLF